MYGTTLSSVALSVLDGGSAVLFYKGSGEVGMIAKAAIPGDLNDIQIRLDQLRCSQLQTVVHQISRKAHAGQLLEQLHEVAFGADHRGMVGA